MGQVNTPDEDSRARDNESVTRDRESNARYQEWLKTQDAPAQPVQANANAKAQDEPKDEEAPEGVFSHYLVLSNGDHVRYDVGDDPYAPFPQQWNGVSVVGVNHA